MTLNRTITFQEQLIELESKLKSLSFAIFQAERFLAAKPEHAATINRCNILQHDKSKTLTNIRRLKERMKE